MFHRHKWICWTRKDLTKDKDLKIFILSYFYTKQGIFFKPLIDGTFIAPEAGVYKAVFNGKTLFLFTEEMIWQFICLGVLKVSGEGKVHANILRRNLTGHLSTEVAGFAKLTSIIKNDLHGALLSVSESITSYVRLEFH